jgi:hypothetical protein
MSMSASVSIPPVTAGDTILSFWHTYNNITPVGDNSVSVELSSDNGASWVGLATWHGYSDWTEHTIRLSDIAAGQAIRIGFRASMSCLFMCSYHWRVDDFRITFNGPGGPPSPTVTPIRTPTNTPTVTPTRTPTTTPHAGRFQDVPPPHPFYAYIECMAVHNIISGYPCGDAGDPCVPDNKPWFHPSSSVTRGQVSKMLSLIAGWADPIPSTQQTFVDVPPTGTFWLWIERLAIRSYISGYPCGGPFEPCVPPGNRPYFRPNTGLTRAQLAKLDAQAAGYTETPTGQTFQDVPPAHTFWGWVEQVAARGIVGGYPCGGLGEPCQPPSNRPYYRPGNNVTRGQTAKILTNTFLPNCPSPTPTPPAPPTPTRTPTGPPPATGTPTETGTPIPTVTGTHDAAVRPFATVPPRR